MRRAFQVELLEREDPPQEQVRRVYRELTRIHRLLGDTAAISSAIRRDHLPVRRILDLGCGHGGVLLDLRSRLNIDVIGVDLRGPVPADLPFSIIQADVVVDPLPAADVAFCMYLGHHLSHAALVRLIRNVGRSCRRFIVLDLVRHPLPLGMFRLLMAPFLSRITATDGQLSIRRSYTPSELRQIAGEALAGSSARFCHTVAPLYIRQVLDISF